MYNEVIGREFARNRMREAQQEVQKTRLLASIEGNSSDEVDQSKANRPGFSIPQILQMLNLRGDLAGSE